MFFLRKIKYQLLHLYTQLYNTDLGTSSSAVHYGVTTIYRKRVFQPAQPLFCSFITRVNDPTISLKNKVPSFFYPTYHPFSTFLYKSVLQRFVFIRTLFDGRLFISVWERLPYLCESSAHPFRGFLGPKNRVRIRIKGTLDAHAKSETMISLSVGLL